jgi:hypothetical protein
MYSLSLAISDYVEVFASICVGDHLPAHPQKKAARGYVVIKALAVCHAAASCGLVRLLRFSFDRM